MSAAPATTNVTRYILIAIALAAVAVILWRLADVFVVGFGGVVLAAVLHAATIPVQRWTKLSRRRALAVVVLVLLVLGGLLLWLFGRQAANQFAEMREQLPAAVQKLREWVADTRIGQVALDSLKQATQGGEQAVQGTGAAFSAIIGGTGNLLLIVFVGIYLAADPKLYRDGALRLLPPSRRGQVGRALDDAGRALHRWLIAQLMVMAAVGALTGIGLGVLGVPLAMTLGLIAGLFEFVPVLGPIAAAVPGVLLAFSQGPQTALYAIGIYVAVQQIESNILTPLIQRWAVELPPVVALLSIVAGGLLFGVLGVIFATPMAVVVMALVQHLYVEDTLENGRAAEPPPRPRRQVRRE